MITVLVFGVGLLGLVAGVLLGFAVGTSRTRAAREVARYRDAIALASDLLATPDALELRDRAQRILAAHRAAHPEQEL